MKYTVISCGLWLSILLLGCSSAEYNEAINSYQQAKATHQLTPVVKALKKLAKLKPKEFQHQFINAQSAQVKLNEAQQHLTDKEFYLAYLASHDSYRQLYSNESKAILIKSGKKLFPVLKVQTNIEKSLQQTQKQLSQTLTNYQKSPIDDWNLIELNNLLEQLSKTALTLNNSLSRLKKDNLELILPETIDWQLSIEARLESINQTLNYLVSLARFRSAIILLTLNQTLAEKSKGLLAITNNPESAKQNMQSDLIKAQRQYKPYKILIENVALATYISKKDIHASWYQEWNELESYIMRPQGDFDYYPEFAEERTVQLKRLIQENKFLPLNLTTDFSKKDEFQHKHQVIFNLIKKLNEDKNLLI
ncbi:MAG: hypothetical protein HRT38_10020 [Alteromonadaceae bacterium]|nr:hypothetical protein [Alteromonadaceae bacterium]